MKTLGWLPLLALLGCNDGDRVENPPTPTPTPPPPTTGLSYDVPKEWKAEKPASNMRKAQFSVPDCDGQEAAAELIVFHFGDGAGSKEDNLARARSQMAPAEDAPEPREETFTSAGGLEVTAVDLTGTYSDQLTGKTLADSRMIWAYVSTPSGPYFFKLVGPRGTVSDWADEFTALLRSIANR